MSFFMTAFGSYGLPRNEVPFSTSNFALEIFVPDQRGKIVEADIAAVFHDRRVERTAPCARRRRDGSGKHRPPR